MAQELSAEMLSLIWGSMRNLLDFDTVDIRTDFGLVGAKRGEFPVDAHQSIFLEMPKSKTRQDVSGRFNAGRTQTWAGLSLQEWSSHREILLPMYAYDEGLEYSELKHRFRSILRNWNSAWIPDNIPCAAVAVSAAGRYCDEREAQISGILLLWANGTATVLRLDWFQGPVEDCISPEWYMKSSSLLPWSAGLQELESMCEIRSRLDYAVYSVLVQPSFIGRLLRRGLREPTGFEGWDSSWRYNDHSDFYQDLHVLIRELRHTSPASHNSAKNSE